jgi:endogenous inhibitor of DNA gyrase (YacG/DUF329 family)
MRCPICKKQVAAGNPEFPFCSQRCRTIDLGHWAAEKYVISTPVERQMEAEVEDEQAGDAE